MVKAMYRDVAERPSGEFHFELGRSLAARLGYPGALLDALPAEAVESFAGVGHYLDLAELAPGERVVDLGSGSGKDAFAAAVSVGPAGRVWGIDMTPEQLRKAERLRRDGDFEQVRFTAGRIEDLPLERDSVDAVTRTG